MQVARIAVIGIALGSGLLAAMLAVRMASRPPEVVVQSEVVEAPRMETLDVLVLRRDVAIGTVISAADLAWQPWPKGEETDSYVVKSRHATAIEDLAGSVARSAFLAGEPVRESRLMKAERGFMSVILAPGMRAVGVEVHVTGSAGGFILPGDHVDMLLTHATQPRPGAPPGGNTFVTETVLTNIKVLAVDQQISEQKGEASMIPKSSVTLEVSPRQAEQVAAAQQAGTIALSLRALRDGEVSEVRNNDQPSTVQVVRFGQISRVTAR